MFKAIEVHIQIASGENVEGNNDKKRKYACVGRRESWKETWEEYFKIQRARDRKIKREREKKK